MSTCKPGLKSHQPSAPTHREGVNSPSTVPPDDPEYRLLLECRERAERCAESAKAELSMLCQECNLSEYQLAQLKSRIFQIEFWSQSAQEWQLRLQEWQAENV